MVEIGLSISIKPIWVFFFFQQERVVYVVFVSRRNNGSATYNLNKEKDSRGCGKSKCERMRKLKRKKKVEDGTPWIFVGISI